MTSSEPGLRRYAFPLEYVTDGVVPRFSNQFTIQVAEGMCYLNFYESRPPLLTGTPDEQMQQMDMIKSVRAEVVASVIVQSAKLGEILQTIAATVGMVAGAPQE